MENKIAKDQDEGGEWITVSRGRRRTKKAKLAEISFLISSFPDFMIQDDLRKVFVKYGQVVDVYAENNLKRSYADLPMDILSSIATRLTPMDLLSFRGTCKDFRSASSDASSTIEYSDTPWLLFHKANSSGYTFYDVCYNKTYSRNIPDLEGASCLGSDHGWLLLFKDESIFFLSPFFLAKIVVPDFPRKNTYGHVAAFSDVPTSPHCVISIFSEILEEEAIEVNMIRKGQSVWTQHKVQIPPPTVPSSFDCLTYNGAVARTTYDHKSQTFYYIAYYVLKLAVKDEQCKPYLVPVPRVQSYLRSYHVFIGKRGGSTVLDRVTVAGSHYIEDGRRHELYVQSVDLTPPKTGDNFCEAIRIQPRFFQVEGNQHW